MLFLFVLRVGGQLLVFLGQAPFLPPMPAWYSGLLPYGPLLLSQVLIIAVLTKACIDLTRRRGFFATPRPAMVVRYVLQGLSIPVVFHWVLAAFILVLASHHRKEAAL